VPRHVRADGAACGAPAESRDASLRARARNAPDLKMV